jgi:hypothetical protein
MDGPWHEKVALLRSVDSCKARVFSAGLLRAFSRHRLVCADLCNFLPSNVMLERTFTDNHSNSLASIDWRAKAGLGAIGGTIVILSLLASPFLLVPASKKLGSLPWMVALR